MGERWVAIRDGVVLGIYVLRELTFFDRPHTFGASVTVRSCERGKGVGTMLFNRMIESATLHGATRVYSEIAEDHPEGLEFAEHRSFKKTGRVERLSRLTVARANLEDHAAVADRIVAEGIEIKTFAQIGIEDEAMMRKIHAMADETSRDVPGSEEFRGFPFEVFMTWITGPGSSPDCCWVALDRKQPVGIARMEHRGTVAFNGYTGVAREYRGRGIARALKFVTIDWARANGFEYIITANDMENRRMLSINIPLGYEALPPTI